MFPTIPAIPEGLGPLDGRDEDMTLSHDGAAVFKLPPKKYLERVAILGTPGTYYVQKVQHEDETYAEVARLFATGHAQDGIDVVKSVYEQSRAAKLDPGFRMLAMLARHEDVEIRRQAFQIVIGFRTLSHLYSFLSFYSTAGSTKGWGRLPKRSFSAWVTRQSAKNLAYQSGKYKSRCNWSLRDILRLCHINPTPLDPCVQLVFKLVIAQTYDALNTTDVDDVELINYLKAIAYLKSQILDETPKSPTADPVEGEAEVKEEEEDDGGRLPIGPVGFSGKKSMHGRFRHAPPHVHRRVPVRHTPYVQPTPTKAVFTDKTDQLDEICATIRKFNLTREFVPTWALKYVCVWRALLLNVAGDRITMPMTALIRNLGTMSYRGVFVDSVLVDLVAKHIENEEVIRRSRTHPATIAVAYYMYASGHGMKGSNSWTPNDRIKGALDAAYYLSFGNVEPTGKRVFHALDGSPSMTHRLGCLPCISASQAMALMVMVFVQVENPATQTYSIFSSGRDFRKFQLTNAMTFEEVAVASRITGWAGTDLSLPMETAIKEFTSAMDRKLSDAEKIEFEAAKTVGDTATIELIHKKLRYQGVYDAINIYTDNDLNSGRRLSVVALRAYRKLVGLPTKMVVMASTVTDFTIADPSDEGMLDLVGFDTQTPQVLSAFIRGDI